MFVGEPNILQYSYYDQHFCFCYQL